MKTAQIYRCKTATEAQDRANLYYIQVNSARSIQRTAHSIQIANGKNIIIAEFVY